MVGDGRRRGCELRNDATARSFWSSARSLARAASGSGWIEESFCTTNTPSVLLPDSSCVATIQYKSRVLLCLRGGRYRTRTYDLVRVKHAL